MLKILSAVIAILGVVLTVVINYERLRMAAKAIIRWISIWFKEILIILFAVLFAIAIIYIFLSRDSINPDNTKYGFEQGTDGWKVQKYKDSQGLKSVKLSSDYAYLGKQSLKIKANLIGGDSSMHKGEVLVEFQRPKNLENIPISLHILFPNYRTASGTKDHYNGVQMFVKDINDSSLYGNWTNINEDDEGWRPIEFIPSKEVPPRGYKSKVFDPTNIMVLGLKAAIGDSSKAKYKGYLYVDSINW